MASERAFLELSHMENAGDLIRERFLRAAVQA